MEKRGLTERIKHAVRYVSHDIWVKEHEYTSRKSIWLVSQLKVILYTLKSIGKHKVIKPDFETTVCNTAALITLNDLSISRDVAQKLVDLGYTVLQGKGDFIKYFFENFVEYN
jgi:hypothetical protein